MKVSNLIGLPFYSGYTWRKHQTLDEVVLVGSNMEPLFITSNREMYNINDRVFMLEENTDLLNSIKSVFPEEFI